MRIAIITFEFNYNYGGTLQAYALSKVLQNMGHSVQIIRRGWVEYAAQVPNFSSLSQIPGYIMGRFITLRGFRSFKNHYMSFSRSIKNEADLKKFGEEIDAIVLGSDQIWNDDIFEFMGFYYFGGVFPDKKKVAYAVSFGKDSFRVPEELYEEFIQNLSTIKHLSVRERSGVTILEGLGFNAINVLDPTLLLDRNDYPICKKTRSKFVCKYFLDETESKKLLAAQISFDLKLNLVNNYLNHDCQIPIIKKIVNNYHIPVERWLANIRDADFVVTDSFHGMLFSIIFEKQFIVLKNNKRGNSRFEDLLELLDLSSRLMPEDITDVDVFSMIPIDYKVINNKLQDLRKKSFDFLESALGRA